MKTQKFEWGKYATAGSQAKKTRTTSKMHNPQLRIA